MLGQSTEDISMLQELHLLLTMYHTSPGCFGGFLSKPSHLSRITDTAVPSCSIPATPHDKAARYFKRQLSLSACQCYKMDRRGQTCCVAGGKRTVLVALSMKMVMRSLNTVE